MSTPHQSPFDHKFERLIELSQRGEGDRLFSELLRHGPSLFDPLSEFLIKQPNEPRIAVLIDLLGKCLDDRAISILMRFLDINVPELRCAAANGLGWMRARVGLEKLDRIEGEDPDPRVRHEARAAIEEILRDFPKLEGLLQNHVPFQAHRNISGEYDIVPEDEPDHGQELKLMATLPRLLANEYKAVPLHLSPGGRLHLAVPAGSERRLEGKLAELTGLEVHLHSWTYDRVDKAIDKFYKMGDDDFCTFHDNLTPVARDEVVELVLSGVRPEEPACPLPEANDAVEAAQSFLACCGQMNFREAHIKYHPPSMSIIAEIADGGSRELEPPEEGNHERFMAAIRILANLNAGAGLSREEGGEIRCTHCRPKFIAKVSSEKHVEHEQLDLVIERVG